MALRRTAPAPETETKAVPGASLARGPALAVGTILLAAGLYFLYKQHAFPRWSNFPNGTPRLHDTAFFGIVDVNGWTGMLTAVAGGLLLFGAAQHLLAKTASLIVAVALGAAAVIALISGNVLGMAAANHWTELGWGLAAVILLLNARAPRRQRVVPVAAPGTAPTALAGTAPTAPAGTAPTAPTAPVTAAPPTQPEPIADSAVPAGYANRVPVASGNRWPDEAQTPPQAPR